MQEESRHDVEIEHFRGTLRRLTSISRMIPSDTRAESLQLISMRSGTGPTDAFNRSRAIDISSLSPLTSRG